MNEPIDKFRQERIEDAVAVIHQYLPKERGPIKKGILDDVQIKRAMKWPWYAKFLLPFCRTSAIGVGTTQDFVCTTKSKRLFGKTYLTQSKIQGLG